MADAGIAVSPGLRTMFDIKYSQVIHDHTANNTSQSEFSIWIYYSAGHQLVIFFRDTIYIIF